MRAAVGVVVLLLCSGAALAQSITAAPSPIEQGQPLTITAVGMDCKSPPSITVADVVVQSSPGAAANTWTIATASLAPKQYAVTVKCGDVSKSANVEVIAPKSVPPPAPPAAPAATTPPGTTAANQPVNRLYVPDGQLRSHKLRVYVTANLSLDKKPQLILRRSHAGTKPDPDEEKPVPLVDVIPGSNWTESIDGHDYARSGTVLLFDASGEPFGVRPMIRVSPTLRWTEGATQQSATTERDVNVGDILSTVLWTVVSLVIALAIVIGLAWRKSGNPMLLLTGVDGHLSLSQAQVACWTAVVAAVVFGFGILRLHIPDIPGSLLVLMGTSLATGGLAYFKDAQREQTAAASGVNPVQRTWHWGDLVRNFTPGQQTPELSLAKAQMILWTLLLLVLFVSKSILDGVMWEIPWPLVALMGFSQVGYLAPKLMQPS